MFGEMYSVPWSVYILAGGAEAELGFCPLLSCVVWFLVGLLGGNLPFFILLIIGNSCIWVWGIFFDASNFLCLYCVCLHFLSSTQKKVLTSPYESDNNISFCM